MKAGDMVRPHQGIRQSRDRPEDLVGIILELEEHGSKLSGSRQVAAVCWNSTGLGIVREWTYQLEVINER